MKKLYASLFAIALVGTASTIIILKGWDTFGILFGIALIALAFIFGVPQETWRKYRDRKEGRTFTYDPTKSEEEQFSETN